MISMCACCGLYGERIEYCGPLVRAGTQYNATTCPARAGLIPRPAPTHWGRGTISACAERSRRPVEQVRVERDHLRVCGADVTLLCSIFGVTGLPPRVRSRRIPRIVVVGLDGITSACAEQTQIGMHSRPALRDYLRVCGADVPWPTNRVGRMGLPSRVRSRRRAHCSSSCSVGITFACAEQTALVRS